MPDHHDSMTHDYFRTADGAHLRFAIWEPLDAIRGTMVIAPGRREFIEKKYVEVGEAFLEKGFRIIIFEWRGQGLSTRALDGTARQRDHITDFNLHLNDFDAFYKTVVTPYAAGPILLNGHSLGAHLLLRYVAEYTLPVPVTAMIVTAPMLALASLPVHGLAQAASWLGVKFDYSDHYAVGQHDYDERDHRFIHNPLSQDENRFRIMERYFTAQPELAVGGITWAWLLAALRSIHQIQRPSSLKRITCPLLSITGSRDNVTPPHELSHYLKYIPNGRNVIISGALHDVMNELDLYRLEAWQHIDKFLAKLIPGNK